MKKPQVYQVNFASIFYFAKEMYDLNWNPCNDLFFRADILDYKSVSDFLMEEWQGNCSFFTDWHEMADIKASNFTKEEVLAMDDVTKAYVIIAAYLELLGFINEDVQIDCR